MLDNKVPQPGLADLVSTLVALDQKVEDEITNLVNLLAPVLAPDNANAPCAVPYDQLYEEANVSAVEKLMHEARQRRMALVDRIRGIIYRARI